MGLISCEACEHEISEAARVCPNCGHPNDGFSALKRGSQPQVVTIQQTSKSYKFLQVVGALVACSGFVACSAGSPGGSLVLILIGMLIYYAARTGAWWSNG